MTAPTAAKATKATAKPVENSPVKDDAPVTEEKNRVPGILNENPILADFCKQYLVAFDEISAYNKEVLAEKDSEWNSHKVLEKAREFARPTNKDDKPDDEIKSALEKWESLVDEVNKARRAVVELGAKKLGITLSATTERNADAEAPLKEKRKVAIEIGKNLSMIAGMTNNKSAADAVTEFFANYPMPAIGRDQARSFGENAKATTPKYRVKVEIYKNDELLLSEDGFTKTALALTNPKFGYDRGQALKSDKLREVWEKAGNSATTTVSPVEFMDNDLKFVITKK